MNTAQPPIERHPWPPFIPVGARYLFLGTFPPKPERWSMPFFYPNKINDFWRVMGLIFFDDRDAFWDEKDKRFNLKAIQSFLEREGIALWDTAMAVRRLKDNASDKFLEIVEPIDLEDLSLTIEKAIQQITYIKAMQQEHTQLEAIKGDLAVAREIQHAILPRIFPPFPEEARFLDIAASMNAAKEVGGDFYDFFHIDGDRIGFVVADVSGKGVPAAIFMAVSRTLIRATGIKGVKPSECISYSNNLLVEESVNSMFVTIFYGIYNIRTGEVTYTNAGHNPPYIIKADGTVDRLPYSDNIIAGIMEGFHFTEETFFLQPGDMLLLYTDGVTEATNNEYVEYGDERLEALLKKSHLANCQQMVDILKADVKAFEGDEDQSDDITLLAIKRL